MMHRAQPDQQALTAFLDEGLAALSRQDIAAARHAFEQARDIAPDRPDAYLNLGSLAQWRQEHAEAIQWYDAALLRQPDLVDARYCRGLSHAAQQQWGKALVDLDAVIALEPSRVEAYFNRSYVYRALQEPTRALSDLTHYLQSNPSPGPVYQQALVWMSELQTMLVEGAPDQPTRLKLARQAYQNGDGDTALRHYDAVISEQPDHREALLARAHLLAVLDRVREARRDMALLLTLYPEDGELWYHRGVLMRRWGDQKAAQESLTRACRFTPELPDIYLEWGRLVEDQDPREALRQYSEALRRNPTFTEALLARATLHTKEKHDLLAVEDYRSALQIDSTLIAAHNALEDILMRFASGIAQAPNLVRPYVARANVFLQLGRTEDALSDWSEALRLDPENAVLIAGRAHILGEQQQYQAAYAEYTRAIELAPDQAGFYYERAHILVEMMRSSSAMQDLNLAIDLAPEKGSYYLLRGQLHRQRDDRDWAMKDLDRAISLAPELATAWEERALLHLMDQRLPAALRDYQRAAALNPTTNLHRDCAAVAEAMGKGALALDHLNHALHYSPNQVDALQERAALLMRQGAWKAARRDLDRVLDQEPMLLDPWIMRAETHFHLGAWEATASDASRAMVRDANCLLAYYLRGMSYFEIGTYAQAAHDLRHYLQARPDSEGREEILRCIRLADQHQRPRRKRWWRS